MKVVLLAAGLGSRLGSLTAEIPKALIPVGGHPLFVHALRFAAQLDPEEVIVVGGFCFPLLAKELESSQRGAGPEAKLRIQLRENKSFRDGNLVSLLTARPVLDDDFLLMNVDHIYRAAIAEIVRGPAKDVTACIDTDRKLGDDDMKVERDEAGCIRKISKTLTTFDAGYVGMTRVPHVSLERYWREVDTALDCEGRAIHVERVLARLAESVAPPLCRDISGHGWLEVDTPDERAHAEEALRDPSWR